MIAGGLASALAVLLALLGGPREAAWCAVVALVAVSAFAVVHRSRVIAVATALLTLSAVLVALEWGDARPYYPIDWYPTMPDVPAAYWSDRLTDAGLALVVPLAGALVYALVLRGLPVRRARWPVVVAAVPTALVVFAVAGWLDTPGQLPGMLVGTFPGWLALAAATAVTWLAVRTAGPMAITGAVLLQLTLALTVADLVNTWQQWWDAANPIPPGAFLSAGVLLNSPAQVQFTEALIVAAAIAGPTLLTLGLPGAADPHGPGED